MNETGGLGTERARETVRVLRDNITSGRWPVNSRIPTESELAAELGVGRSTIREAVRALANLGMLEPARSRGTFVRARNPVSSVLSDVVTQHTIDDVLAVRRALEVEAAELAAKNRTDDDLALLRSAHESDVAGASAQQIERGLTPGQFHALLFAAARNPFLAELYAGITAGLRTWMRDGSVAHAADTAQRHSDHAAILDAIAAQDPSAAAAAAAAHVARDLVVGD
ncbi:DNA-binding FadR family transcriptional regulator [Mumia flava]|uniref:DNA-binding FadR family transcriptional regulator n=1 Tax=Mumia flava TaxID=1348852 RepID=A0A0B2BCR2_9ACTN|nr:FCD domain-containing protein [Mumia flava]PJJ58321.1 DNA-binding FadR family transcriptional regulator [Mumia flava]